MARRAGRWVRNRSWVLQWRFIRKNPTPIVIFCLFGAGLATATYLLLPGQEGAFVAGVVAGSVIWALLLIAQGWTGTGGRNMGAEAEGWTSSELRRLRRGLRKDLGEAWYLVDHIPLANWDVDHVLIGPRGVFALETKWSADGWMSDWSRGRLPEIARAARVDARKIEAILRAEPYHLHLAVVPVVVLWPNGTSPVFAARQADTAVVFGSDLTDWFRSQPPAIDGRDADLARQAMVRFVRMRDAFELSRAGAGQIRRLWHRLWLTP